MANFKLPKVKISEYFTLVNRGVNDALSLAAARISESQVISHSRRIDLTCFIFNENPLLQPNTVASDCFFYLNHLQNFEDERKFSYTFVLPLHFTTETSTVLGRLKSYG